MKLSKIQLDVLYRVALAGFYTCPSNSPTYNREATFTAMAELSRRQLVVGWPARITADGNTRLDIDLDPERLGQLNRLRAKKQK